MIISKFLEEITDILKNEGAEKIILFGLYAYGNSDEDLLTIESILSDK